MKKYEKPEFGQMKIGVNGIIRLHEAKIVELEQRITSLVTDNRDLERRLEAKEQSVTALKAELAAVLSRNAGLEGYIARALEDDAVREMGPSFTPPSRDPAPTARSIRSGLGVMRGSRPTSGDTVGYGVSRSPAKPWHDL